MPLHLNEHQAPYKGAYFAEHGLEGGPALGVEAPGDVTRRGLQVLEALRAAALLDALDEAVEGAADALQEQLVPGQELAVPLQEIHRDRQHPPQDVREPVPELHARPKDVFDCCERKRGR